MARRSPPLALLLVTLAVAGCGRGCARAPAQALTVAAVTTTSLTLDHPGAGGVPWTVSLATFGPKAAAPQLLPDPQLKGRWLVRWTAPDGAHEVHLDAHEESFRYSAPSGSGTFLFQELADLPRLTLLPHGVVLETTRGTAVEVIRWRGALGDGVIEVIDHRAGSEGVTLVLRDGAPLDMKALGGSLHQGFSRNAAGLAKATVKSPALTFSLEWLDPASDEVTTIATVDGRAVPLVLRRVGP